MRSNQREVMACICGTVLVVVARFRAAVVLRLCCGFSPLTLKPASIDSVAVTDHTAIHGRKQGCKKCLFGSRENRTAANLAPPFAIGQSPERVTINFTECDVGVSPDWTNSEYVRNALHPL